MKFYTIDLEWQVHNLELLTAALYAPEREQQFDTIGDLLATVVKLPKNSVIYSHYGGASDFLFLLREIVGSRKYYLSQHEFFERKGHIVAFTMYYNRKRFQFRDSWCLLPEKLEKLALDFIGEHKLYDSTHLADLDIVKVREQCMNDARLLWHVIEFFRQAIGQDDLQLTIGSQALKDLCERCDIEQLSRQTDEEYRTFLSWFAGGHVDVYQRYAESVYHYDIKSCYATSMKRYGCPIGDWKYVTRRHENKAGLYVVRVKPNTLENPFTWRICNQKLYFLHSMQDFYLTDIEVNELEQYGIAYKVIGGYEWNCDSFFFDNFVEYWFNQRKLNCSWKTIGKLYLNNAYGKFAVKRWRDKIIFGEGADYYFTPDYQIGVVKDWKNFWYSQIHLGSRITAGARVILFKAQNQCGIDGLCYSDTDSVFCKNSIMINHAEVGLGDLELQGHYDRAYFIGNKFYGLAQGGEGTSNGYDFKCILKGFPETFTEESFRKALFYQFDFSTVGNRMLRFRSALRSASEFVALREFKRHIDHVEIKRRILSDGVHTKPYLEIDYKLC